MAPRRRVVWSQRALDSLDEVLSYISQDSSQGARSVATSALEIASSLSTLAERGRIVPEVGRSSIREVFVFRYRLMYRIEADQVTVIAFVHSARDFERWRRDSEE